MGIDVYASWAGMTPEEAARRNNLRAGAAGYLREAYHGGPYATHVLVPEAFEDELLRPGWGTDEAGNETDEMPVYFGAEIASDLLISRLESAVHATLIRAAELRGNTQARTLLAEIGIETRTPHTYDNEVKLDGATEAERDAAFVKASADIIANMLDFVCEQEDKVPDRLYPYPPDWMDRAVRIPEVMEIVCFVAACAMLEGKTGHPIRIYASY